MWKPPNPLHVISKPPASVAVQVCKSCKLMQYLHSFLMAYGFSALMGGWMHGGMSGRCHGHVLGWRGSRSNLGFYAFGDLLLLGRGRTALGGDRSLWGWKVTIQDVRGSGPGCVSWKEICLGWEPCASGSEVAWREEWLLCWKNNARIQEPSVQPGWAAVSLGRTACVGIPPKHAAAFFSVSVEF